MRVYSVTPQSAESLGTSFNERLAESVRRCEVAGWDGLLVPHNLHEVDPWLVAAHVGARSDRLIPLVAVQPSSIPPHTAAAVAAAFASLYGRPLHFQRL